MMHEITNLRIHLKNKKPIIQSIVYSNSEKRKICLKAIKDYDIEKFETVYFSWQVFFKGNEIKYCKQYFKFYEIYDRWEESCVDSHYLRT